VAGGAAAVVEVVELEVALPVVDVLVVAVVDVVVVTTAGVLVAALVLEFAVVLGAPEPPQPPTAAPASSAQTSTMFALRVMRPRAQI
jgi:hypothetical protein